MGTVSRQYLEPIRKRLRLVRDKYFDGNTRRMAREIGWTGHGPVKKLYRVLEGPPKGNLQIPDELLTAISRTVGDVSYRWLRDGSDGYAAPLPDPKVSSHRIPMLLWDEEEKSYTRRESEEFLVDGRLFRVSKVLEKGAASLVGMIMNRSHCMEPTIRAGDPVLIHQGSEYTRPGEYLVSVVPPQECAAKPPRIAFVEASSPNEYSIQFDNPDYPDHVVTLVDGGWKLEDGRDCTFKIHGRLLVWASYSSHVNAQEANSANGRSV